MRLSLLCKSVPLGALLLLASCGTVKYADSPQERNFSGLQPGRTYGFTLTDGRTQRMVYTNNTADSLIGYRSAGNPQRVSLGKNMVKASRDRRKSIVTGAGAVIGAAGLGAVIYSATRASKD